jgi:hypothetical protein
MPATAADAAPSHRKRTTLQHWVLRTDQPTASDTVQLALPQNMKRNAPKSRVGHHKFTPVIGDVFLTYDHD